MQAQTNNMAKVAKTQNKNKKQSLISKEDRRKLSRAYYQMYKAFLLNNLLLGMTLGAASHNAIQLVRTKLSTMDRNNPVTEYLLRIHSHHSRHVAKKVMTSKYRDFHATATPETRAKINTRMPMWTKFSLDIFNNMSEKYKPRVSAKQKPLQTVAKPTPVAEKSVVAAKQPQVVLLQIKLKQQQHAS